MSDQFPPIPAGSTIRKNADGSWQYRSKPGPWCDMPAPQKAAPWATPTHTEQPATVDPTLCDRIARALCAAMWPDRNSDGPRPCRILCEACRNGAAAVAHEIADYFSELYGGASNTDDVLYAVGTHQHAPPPGWQPIDPVKEAMALAVSRELRRPDV